VYRAFKLNQMIQAQPLKYIRVSLHQVQNQSAHMKIKVVQVDNNFHVLDVLAENQTPIHSTADLRQYVIDMYGLGCYVLNWDSKGIVFIPYTFIW